MAKKIRAAASKSNLKSEASAHGVPEDVMRAWRQAVKARENAYAPYSKFKVGAVVMDDKDQIHTGCNVENASYGGTICAERTAVVRAVADGAKSLRHVVVVTDMSPPATPCALCLQVLSEFSTEATRVWLADLGGVREGVSMKELLPRHFGPKSLARGLKR